MSLTPVAEMGREEDLDLVFIENVYDPDPPDLTRR